MMNSGRLGEPEATILQRVEGRGFTEPHVLAGDLVIADSRVKPGDGGLVVASVDGERVVGRFLSRGSREFLCTGGESDEELEVGAGSRVEILATVVSVIPVIPEP